MISKGFMGLLLQEIVHIANYIKVGEYVIEK